MNKSRVSFIMHPAVWTVLVLLTARPGRTAVLGGQVTDTLSGAPIESVLVRVDGTQDTTYTDAAGVFSLTVTSDIQPPGITLPAAFSGELPGRTMVAVYNPQGLRILAGRYRDLSVRSLTLPEGIYLLQAADGDGTYCGKLVTCGGQSRIGRFHMAKPAVQTGADVMLICSHRYYSTKELTVSDGDTNISVQVALKKGWELDATTVGLAGAGVDKNTLPVYDGSSSGNTTVIPGSTTVTLRKIWNPDCSAGDITLDRCWLIKEGNPSSPTFSVNGPVTLRDCDVEATHYYGSPIGSSDGNQLVTVLRCNVSGGQALFYMNGSALVQQCYGHDMMAENDNHCDGMTRRGGTDQVDIVNCHIDSYTDPNHTSATIFLQSNGYFNNLLFRGNFVFNGTGRNGSVALEAKDGNEYGTNLVMDNNRFFPADGIQPAEDPVPGAYSPYGYTYDYNTGTTGLGWGQWTDNYVYDPGKENARGALILEPSK